MKLIKNIMDVIECCMDMILYNNYFTYLKNRVVEYNDDTNYCVLHDNEIKYNTKYCKFIILDVYDPSTRTSILAELMKAGDVYGCKFKALHCIEYPNYTFAVTKVTVPMKEVKWFEEMASVLSRRCIFKGYIEYHELCKKYIWPMARVCNRMIAAYEGGK